MISDYKQYKLPSSLKISVESENPTVFLVDDPKRAGSPPVGRGATMLEAMGSWLHRNQSELGLSFEVDETAWPYELKRREEELAKR